MLAVVVMVGSSLVMTAAAVANQGNHGQGVGVPPDNQNADVTFCHVKPTPGVPAGILTLPEQAFLNGHQPHGDFIMYDGAICPPPPPPPPPNEPTDVCPNLEGDQATVPDGYELVDGNCVQPPPPPPPPNEPTDVCPNIDGDQATVPDGYELVDGNCVEPTPTEPEAPAPEEPTTTAAEPATPDTGPEPGATDAPATTGEETVTAGAADTPSATTAPTTTTTPTNATGELPFTGLPQQWIALAGAALVLLGIALHVLPARRPQRATTRS